MDAANFRQFILRGQGEEKTHPPNQRSVVGQETQSEDDEDEDVQIIDEPKTKRRAEGSNTKESVLPRSRESVLTQKVNRRAAGKTRTRKKRRQASWKSDSDEEEDEIVGSSGDEGDQRGSTEEKRPERGRPTRRRRKRGRVDWREEDDDDEIGSNEEATSTATPSETKPQQSRRVQNEKKKDVARGPSDQGRRGRPPKGQAKSDSGGTRRPARGPRSQTEEGWKARQLEGGSASDEEEAGLDRKKSAVDPLPPSMGPLEIVQACARANVP